MIGRSWCQLQCGFHIFGFKVRPGNYFLGLACNVSLLTNYYVRWCCRSLITVYVEDILSDAQWLNIRVGNLVDSAFE